MLVLNAAFPFWLPIQKLHDYIMCTALPHKNVKQTSINDILLSKYRTKSNTVQPFPKTMLHDAGQPAAVSLPHV